MTDEQRRAANLATVESAFAAIGAGRVDDLSSSYTDDYVLELPYSHPEPKRIEGFAAVEAFLRGALAVFEMRLWVTDVHETTDPDVLVLEYASEGRVTTTDRPYANTYIGVFRFRDGKVCGLKEFVNPLPAQAALE